MTTRTRENTFNLDQQSDRNKGNTYSAINIGAMNYYKFMDDAYFGQGGFRNGDYLIPFSLESDYLSRKKLAYYKNYVKPIIRAMVEPVFGEEAKRSITDQAGNPITNKFSLFTEDVDVGGTSIQDFTHNATNICRRHGVSFIVMDNFNYQPESEKEAIQNRLFPYVYIKKAWEVDSFDTDMFGNLDWITFIDKPEKVNGREQQRFSQWTQTEYRVLTSNSNGKKTLVSSYVHGLGKVPVIMTFSDTLESKETILVDPPLYDIAKLNYVIFQMSAELRDLERAQAFSILFAQGIPAEAMATGPKNYVNIPIEASISPGYASPDFGIMTGLVANQEQIRKDLYTIAEQAGVVGVQSSESGISKAFDFFAHEDTLKRSSDIAEFIEYKISDMFQTYTKEDYIYTVNYKKDFAPMGLDREIDRIDKVLKMSGLNRVFASKIQEKLARLLMSDEDRTVVDEIINDIRSSSVEQISVTTEPTVVEEPIIKDDSEDVTEE
jgi:hypothetical protein